MQNLLAIQASGELYELKSNGNEVKFMLSPELKKEVLEFMDKIYNAGRADAFADISKAVGGAIPHTTKQPTIRTVHPPTFYGGGRAHPLKTGTGFRPNTVAFTVREWILKNEGRTIAEIRDGIKKADPAAQDKTIRTALDRMKADGILDLVGGRWYTRKGVMK